MDISVALLMDQRNVADWPASMVEGSAVKLFIIAFGGGGAGSCCGGGGGGGGGAFFLHPAAKNNSDSAISTALILTTCNLKLRLILFSPLTQQNEINCSITAPAPYRLFVVARRGQLALAGSVGKHGPDLRFPSLPGRIDNVHAIGGPTRVLIPSFFVRELGDVFRGYVHDEYVVTPWSKTFRPCECDVLPVGRP
jgi:hypothetical protein